LSSRRNASQNRRVSHPANGTAQTVSSDPVEEVIIGTKIHETIFVFNSFTKLKLGSAPTLLTVIRIRLGKEHVNKVIALMMLVLGLVSLLGSVLYSSYVAAFIGLGLSFWGALLLYIIPSKHVRLDLFTAAASSSLADIQKVLVDSASVSVPRGVYLPPKLLKDYRSSLVFVPSSTSTRLPKREEVDEENLRSKSPAGIYLTPPGLALSRLFEKELNVSFTETDLDYLQRELPKLFEKLEISKNTTVETVGATVIVTVSNHIFRALCEETSKLKRTHEAVGCPLSSALACALAKATGKPVIIEKEETTPDQSTTIRYIVLEA